MVLPNYSEKKGVFYEIVGQEVSGLDGFYGHVWKEYEDIGIELPEKSRRSMQ